MIEALKKKYALSDQGARDLFKGIVYSVLANISLMLPVILLAVVLNQLLAPLLGTATQEFSIVFIRGLELSFWQRFLFCIISNIQQRI